LHYRKNGRTCGLAAEGTNGIPVSWCECPGQELVAQRESLLDHLTTGQVAERLQVDVSSVVRLLAAGKLAGSKVNDQWRISSMALREYLRVVPLRRRIAR
jgi:excisionase family DNA binding protein